MIRNLGMRSALATVVLAGAVVWSTSAAAASDPWAKGAQWMSIRAGYAKALGDNAAESGAGYGFGWSRMLNKRYSFGLYAHHEILSRSNGAAEMAFPFTAELARHFRWRTDLHPYLGVGGGGINYRTYRSGDDHIGASNGVYLVGGMNTPIAPQQVLGLDLRFLRRTGNDKITNPSFGRQKSSVFDVGLKLNWSYAY